MFAWFVLHMFTNCKCKYVVSRHHLYLRGIGHMLFGGLYSRYIVPLIIAI